MRLRSEPLWVLSLYPDAGEGGGCLSTSRQALPSGGPPDSARAADEAARRARAKIRRYAAANRLNRLGTLTYGGEGCHDPLVLRAHLSSFFRELRVGLDAGAFPYLWVPQWHPGGHGLHAHFTVGRFVPRRLIERSWGHGFVHIKLLDGLPVGSGALAGLIFCRERIFRHGQWRPSWMSLTRDADTTDIRPRLRGQLGGLPMRIAVSARGAARVFAAALIVATIAVGQAGASGGIYVPPASTWSGTQTAAASADLESIPVAASAGGYTELEFASLVQMSTAAGTDTSLATAFTGGGAALATPLGLGAVAVAIWTYDGVEIYRLLTSKETAPPGAHGDPCWWYYPTATATSGKGGCINNYYPGFQASTQLRNYLNKPTTAYYGAAITSNYWTYCTSSIYCGAYPGSGAYASLTGMPGNVAVDPPGAVCDNGADPAGGHCFVKWLTGSQMLELSLESQVLTASGFSNYSGTKVTLPSDPPHRMAQVPNGDLGATTVDQAIDAANCSAPSAQSTQDEAGCQALGIDAGVLLYAPNCAGLSVSACESAFTTAGFTGSPTVETAATTDANLAYGPGAVIATTPTTGSLTAFNATVTITRNPDPLPTYAVPNCIGFVLADCEVHIASAAATAGSPPPTFDVTTATLSADYGMLPGAVLSVDPGEGATGVHASVALDVNPDPLGGSSGGSGWSGGGTTTTGSSDECKFDDYAWDPTGSVHVDWDTIRNEDPEKYDAACADAWATARSLGIVTESGGVDEAWIIASKIKIPGEYLDNEAVENLLTQGGRTMTQWGKYGVQFETSNGTAELHFYRMNASSEVNLGMDFAVVFKNAF